MFLIRFIQLLLILIPISLFGWLWHQEIVPSGTFLITHSVNEASPFIDRLLPDQRVSEPEQNEQGEWFQTVTGDPAFFFVHPHRSFDTVQADIWFQNDTVPIVELGVLGDEQSQSYSLEPLQNLILDRLNWPRIGSNGLVLLQRQTSYPSINAFLENPPPMSEIATYQANLTQPFVLDDYAPESSSVVVDVSLRGFHEFKTYIKDEMLAFDFAYMDMNRDEGADGISILVTNADGVPVGDARASDDGNTLSDANPSELRRVSVAIPSLPEGVYKVALQVDRDIFWRTVTTSQQKMVFLNNVFLADEVAYREPAQSVHFWTEAKHLAFVTRHAEGVQSVSTGLRVCVVTVPYARCELEVTEEGVQEVMTERGDLEVTTDGHIAFLPGMYFNPDPVRLVYNTDLDRLGINYVIASYTSPRREGNWYVAHATFDTSKMVFDKGAWKFVISTPGITSLGASMNVGRIDLTLLRDPFSWTDLYEYLAGKN